MDNVLEEITTHFTPPKSPLECAEALTYACAGGEGLESWL